MFEVGEKVVCVNDSFAAWVHELYQDMPKKNEVYVVRDVTPGHNYLKGEVCAILLVGMMGNINKHGIENGFAANRFRRLDDIKKSNKAKNKKKKKLEV